MATKISKSLYLGQLSAALSARPTSPRLHIGWSNPGIKNAIVDQLLRLDNVDQLIPGAINNYSKIFAHCKLSKGCCG